jgi:hypothetical protein
MKSAIGITWIFVMTACATASRPEDRSASETAEGARSQLDNLRSLEGVWWGTGGQGTDRNPVEFRYRVTAGGTVVEETCFFGTPEEVVTRYHVDGTRLVGTRASAAGAPVQLDAAPDHAVVRVTLGGWSSSIRRTCPDDPDFAPSLEWHERESESKEDPTCHILEFAPMDVGRVEGQEARGRPEYDLMIMGGGQIVATWRSAGSDGKSESIRSYHLTRKLPGSVERTAEREVPGDRGGQVKKSWQSEKAYWDLRSEP